MLIKKYVIIICYWLLLLYKT